MSGIVCVANLDGAPVDRTLLQKLTDSMAFRGPDGCAIWLDGAVGLGHTMLRTSTESLHESQPFTLDGQVWIVADARVDARAELIGRLGRSPHSVFTDVELILRAYLRWQEDCVGHLLGDFAFIIWDAPQRKFFCARDHLGVKQLHYSRVGSLLIASNTLNCIRLHPAVSARLNERAIGDFLLASVNCDLATTFFADIQTLLAAHTLTSRNGEDVHARRYWKLALPDVLYHMPDRDCLERFTDVMTAAVSDRMRTEKVAAMFSGGLDSTTMVALAMKAAPRVDLQGFTIVYDSLFVDPERHYAEVAAEALGMQVHFQRGDHFDLFESAEDASMQTPEPVCNPQRKLGHSFIEAMSQHSRVALYGQGGDEVLLQATLWEIFRSLRSVDQVLGILASIVRHRLCPPLGLGIMSALRRRRDAKENPPPSYPDWLQPDFAKRLDLPSRWHEINCEKPSGLASPEARSHAYKRLTSPLWDELFRGYDPAFTGLPLEVRLPYMDLRVIDYLLSIPPVPWCIKKELLRRGMSGTLPEAVRRRPKCALAGDPVSGLLREGRISLGALERLPELDDCVNLQMIGDRLAQTGGSDAWATSGILRPFSLGYWLRCQGRNYIDKNSGGK